MVWYRILIPTRLWIKEILIVFLVLSSYFLVGLGSSERRSAALENSKDLVSIEQAMGIFREVQIQQIVIDSAAVSFVGGFYVFIHPLVTVFFIVGLFLSNSDKYPYVRNVFAIFSLLSFLIFLIYPSAPPRMMTEYGFTDMLRERGPISYEIDVAKGLVNPYAAMPSVHFGYSLIIAATILTFRRPLISGLGLVYVGLMLFSVTASANHLFIDCLASVLLLGATYVTVGRLDLPGHLTIIYKNMRSA